MKGGIVVVGDEIIFQPAGVFLPATLHHIISKNDIVRSNPLGVESSTQTFVVEEDLKNAIKNSPSCQYTTPLYTVAGQGYWRYAAWTEKASHLRLNGKPVLKNIKGITKGSVTFVVTKPATNSVPSPDPQSTHFCKFLIRPVSTKVHID